MLFARAGLAYADKVLIALCGSWLIVFISLRFIVGPANRRPDEHVVRKGVRLATNYIIKQFYQQMFFFLVPLYASSATWAFGSWNWWLAPVLLVCAVLSTMDLVFDNFIMEHRFIASLMYGLALFGMTNVLVPLLMGVSHFEGLLVAGRADPDRGRAAVVLDPRPWSRPRARCSSLAATMALVSGVWYGRALIPPAPMAMTEGAIGHGTLGSYECLPASKHVIPRTELDGLRCGSLLREPGGSQGGRGPHLEARPRRGLAPAGRAAALRRPRRRGLPHHAAARQAARRPDRAVDVHDRDDHGQLVGMRHFDVVGPAPTGAGSGSAAPRDGGAPVHASDAGAPRGAGSPVRDAGAPRDAAMPARRRPLTAASSIR